MTGVKVTFEGFTATSGNYPAPNDLPKFQVALSHNDVFFVRVLWTDMLEMQRAETMPRERLREVPWATVEIEQRVRAGLRPPEGSYLLDIPVTWAETEAMLLFADKYCEYRERSGRDSFYGDGRQEKCWCSTGYGSARCDAGGRT